MSFRAWLTELKTDVIANFEARYFERNPRGYRGPDGPPVQMTEHNRIIPTPTQYDPHEVWYCQVCARAVRIAATVAFPRCAWCGANNWCSEMPIAGGG